MHFGAPKLEARSEPAQRQMNPSQTLHPEKQVSVYEMPKTREQQQ